MMFSQNHKIVTGIAPAADPFAGTAYTDVVNVKNYGHVTFVVNKGVGATGTATLTVEACDDATPSNTQAIPFRYSRQVDSTNVTGALTAATTAGFLTTAGSNEKYIIEVDVAELASEGYGYVRLKSVEGVDSPVAGSVDVILSEPRYAQAALAAAIA